MSRQDLARAIKATATYYNRQLDAEVLTMMCDDLADLNPTSCIEAYAKYRRNPANRAFPLPAQIRELVNPEQYVSVETQAREIAARIVGSVRKFGWCNGTQAAEYIGPKGWQLVQRQGGWGKFCETLTDKQAPIIQAQLRDQLEGILRYSAPVLDEAVKHVALPENVRAILPAAKAPDDQGPKGAA